jgi:hypothetical protein
MARGGLTQLQSNLPINYLNGGIVAVEVGGSTGRQDAIDVINQNMPDPSVSTEGIDRFKGSMTEYLKLREQALNAVKNNFPAPELNPDEAAAYQAIYGRIPVQNPKLPERAAAPVAPVAPVVPPEADKQASPVVKPRTDLGGNAGAANVNPAQAQGLGALGAAPTMSADDLALKKLTQTSVMRGMNIDPETAKAAAKVEYENLFGKDQRTALANQQAGLEKIQALQKQGQEQRPSDFWRALELMGKNKNTVGLGGAMTGVSEGVNASKAAYNKADQAYQVEQNALIAAMDAAKKENNIGAFNAAKNAFEKSVQEREAYTKDATQMANVNEAALTRKTQSWDAAQTRLIQIRDLNERASAAATARGDLKVANMLDSKYKNAVVEGRRLADSEAKLNVNMANPNFNPTVRAFEITKKMLDDDQRYQAGLKAQGFETASEKTSAKPTMKYNPVTKKLEAV